MLLITLVENSIKHGLEPIGGGHIEVRARRRRNELEVSVLDDGAGFGAAAHSGTGVGLVNVKRQLVARYNDQARLTLEEREPHGARATITLPLRNTYRTDLLSDVASVRDHADRLATHTAQCSIVESSNGFLLSLRTHRGAVVMAGLLAFAGPLTFFTGAVSVMRTPTVVDVVRLGGWTLYGISLWCALLFGGYNCARVAARFGRRVRGAIWFLAAGVVAAVPNLLTAERATLLIEQGLVQGARTMHLHGFIFSLIMALLYFAHLGRARDHEQAVARLAVAQTAQRQIQNRIIQARLQEVQARIDPQILFEMLDVLRHLYEHSAAHAERFLDELIAFLRASLPRLRTVSSSLLREAELARAFVRLHALAHDTDFDMTVRSHRRDPCPLPARRFAAAA